MGQRVWCAGERFNRWLDALVRREVRVLNRSWSTFHVGGAACLALGVALAITLGLRLGVAGWAMVALIVSGLVGFLGRAMIVKICAGAERLTFYYDLSAVIASVALAAWWLEQPILAALEPVILGTGLCQAVGRVSCCMMVGCCHGQPSRWGVRYREDHAVAGFPRHLVGVRLFPVQLIETLWGLAVVGVTSVLVWMGQPPGSGGATYLLLYAGGRFPLEFWRGDPGRRHWGGFSEAQWTSQVLALAVVGLELSGLLPFQAWHAGAALAAAVAMLAIAVGRWSRRTQVHRLLHPDHVREVAQVVEEASNSDGIQVGCTSLGIRISTGKIWSAPHHVYHYTISAQDGSMGGATIEPIARLILLLKHASAPSRLVRGRGNVLHVLVTPLDAMSSLATS